MPKSNVFANFYLEKPRALGGTPPRAVVPPGPRRPHEGPRAAARLYLLAADSRDKLSCVDTCVNNGICSGIREYSRHAGENAGDNQGGGEPNTVLRSIRLQFGIIKEITKKHKHGGLFRAILGHRCRQKRTDDLLQEAFSQSFVVCHIGIDAGQRGTEVQADAPHH